MLRQGFADLGLHVAVPLDVTSPKIRNTPVAAEVSTATWLDESWASKSSRMASEI